MAIAGSLLKQAANIVGKAIKVTKKKKGQVGGKLKKQFKKEADFIDKKIVKPAKDRVSKLKDKAKPQFIKGMPNPKAMYAGTKAKASEIADAAVNTQAFTKGAEAIKKGTKAIKATAGKAKKATRRMANSPFGIAATASAAELNKATGGFISGKNIAAVAGVAGALGLTQSIIKSNSSPEQEYTQERRSDGRFATTYKGKNANVVASAKQLSTKEIDDVRTRLAVLDSILESNDPKSRSKEFKETVAYLATKYQISNISGKQLSIIIPNIKGGVQTFKKRTGISKLLLGDPSTNKNIQAAQRYYDENIKG